MNKRDFLQYIVDCVSRVIYKPQLTQIRLSRTCLFLYKVLNVWRIIRLILYNVTDVKELLTVRNYDYDLYHRVASCYHEFRWKQSPPLVCFSPECYGKDKCFYGETSKYDISLCDKSVRWVILVKKMKKFPQMISLNHTWTRLNNK
jgi:hypothetical protein